MWFVYMILCEGGSLYTGISNDPYRRFLDHKKGNGSKYMRLHKPLKIVYIEKLRLRSDALKREMSIKSWSREEKIKVCRINI